MSATTIGLTGDQSINALLDGIRWAGGTVSFSFTNTGADCGGNAYDQTFDEDGGGPLPPVTFNESDGIVLLNGIQREAAHMAFEEIEQFSNLNLDWNFTTTGAADVRLAMTTAPDPREDSNDTMPGVQWTAYAFKPGAGRAGDIWFNPIDYLNPLLGTFAYATIFHEIGHALGLKHAHEPGDRNATVHTADRNSLEFSSMPYAAFIGDTDSDWDEVSNGHFPQCFMMYDIAALQHMYGADYSDDSSSVYRFDPRDGRTYLNGISIGDPAQFPGSPPSVVNVIFRTIWDGGGYDTYDFSLYDDIFNMDIDLAAGGWTDVDRDGHRQSAFLGGGPNSGKHNLAARGGAHATFEGGYGEYKEGCSEVKPSLRPADDGMSLLDYMRTHPWRERIVTVSRRGSWAPVRGAVRHLRVCTAVTAQNAQQPKAAGTIAEVSERRRRSGTLIPDGDS